MRSLNRYQFEWQTHPWKPDVFVLYCECGDGIIEVPLPYGYQGLDDSSSCVQNHLTKQFNDQIEYEGWVQTKDRDHQTVLYCPDCEYNIKDVN